MKASNGNKKKNKTDRRASDKSRNGRLLPALMAVGGACGIMSAPASALELGDLKINSSLGQPLRASIAYALNAHEQLFDYCIYLRPGAAASGLPVLSRATVSIADGMILLSGSRAIREPLLTMQVSIDCPYTAHLSREYTLLINPATPVVRTGPVVAEPSRGAESQTATTATETPKRQPTVESPRNIDRSPISGSTRYLVQRGDSLSEIASRISDRSIALWPAVDRIFAANEDAFIDGDVNRLRAGVWLAIPNLSDATPESLISDAESPAASVPASDAGQFAAYTGYQATETAEALPVPVEPDTPSEVQSDAAESDYSKLQPGDVVLDGDTPFVSPIGAEGDLTTTIDIPDTEITDPAVVAPSVQPIPVVNTGNASSSWSWLAWLGGTGLAVILTLLFFGQRFKGRFGSTAVGATSEPVPNRRRTDSSTQTSEVDFQVQDALPNSPSLTLDADFDDGSGLHDVSDMDVAQDFGFSASTSLDEKLDMVLPEFQDQIEEDMQTDAYEPSEHTVDAPTADNEVLANEGDDADYDVSMIVDVTKEEVVQSDVTEKDLQAVQVDSGSEPESDDYTLNQDVDYKILEQDYEDEFTATMALNLEIEKAAAELADRMDSDVTAEMTAKLPENTQAENDDINSTAPYAEITVELPGTEDEATVEMPGDDREVTVEMPARNGDVPIDMEIESGKIDTKKKKAS